jgi:hypothetical protein
MAAYTSRQIERGRKAKTSDTGSGRRATFKIMFSVPVGLDPGA